MLRSFARVFFADGTTLDQLYATLAPVVARFSDLPEGERQDFRGQVTDYGRLFRFWHKCSPSWDADLEKLYVFAKHLRRLLSTEREELPREIQQSIDMESYRIQQTGSGKVAIGTQGSPLDPVTSKETRDPTPEELEALSRIIADLNERFGIELGAEHRVTLGRMLGPVGRRRGSGGRHKGQHPGERAHYL